MTVFKCKMCGGTLEFASGDSVAVCDSCGTKQTLPKLDDDRRANLYDRANHFRRNNEFDKAEGIYEQILNEDNTDAEAYWSLVLCHYGIEYVEDPATHRRVPTINRTQFTSIFDDANYKSALQYGDAAQIEVYEAEAIAINEIQKGILSISQREEPFDVFICYKETDEHGRRTQDSVLANELYHELIREGFKVFFSRITLEDKLGTAYEPYIFAALNSAKVMVVIGTKPKYFNAVWVKNEWSRYLSLIKNGARKILIPAYRDMDPYDLPEEFSHLQAQDMGKLGFMQDLIRGIKKLTESSTPKGAVEGNTTVNMGNVNLSSLLKRVFLFLEDGNWKEADAYCERVLDQDPECAEAYLGKLMVKLQVRTREGLKNCAEPFDNLDYYHKTIRFADEKLKKELFETNEKIKEKKENARQKEIYKRADAAMNAAKSERTYKEAANIFGMILGYEDAEEKREECLSKAEECRKDNIYEIALMIMVQADEKIGETEALPEDTMEKMLKIISDYKEAIRGFKMIPGWRDSDEQIYLCEQKIEESKQQREYIEKRVHIATEKKARRKKYIRIVIFVESATLVCLLLLNFVVIPLIKYNVALGAIDKRDYETAIDILENLGDYRDSEKKLQEAKYNIALKSIENKDHETAIAILEKLGNYKDSEEKLQEAKYNIALKLIEDKDYKTAYDILIELRNYKDSAEKLEDVQKIMKWESINIGDIISYGHYELDNVISNGAESIEWVVLDKKSDRILLISKYILKCEAYQTENAYLGLEWENCTIRNWLNTEFYQTAFSATENEFIITTKISVDDSKYTEDKLFLLSADEVKDYFSNEVCSKYKQVKSYGSKAYVRYWLRSQKGIVALVWDDGNVQESGISGGFASVVT